MANFDEFRQALDRRRNRAERVLRWALGIAGGAGLFAFSEMAYPPHTPLETAAKIGEWAVAAVNAVTAVGTGAVVVTTVKDYKLSLQMTLQSAQEPTAQLGPDLTMVPQTEQV